ncbi:hypothetical protein L6164_032950 [Bauhinia variegata]|uniref:Uncharacterized protein n=1 Tax=Bauhinia variegata TaxID=167791 RepID=A0ACB9KQC8_BAUVA|nr:hypothetical protein L6164_032950 [Bauhinia variegata]
MENNKKQVGSSSSSTNFDHLFGPKDPSSTSSSSSSIFGSIFPPSSTVGGRDSRKPDVGSKNFGTPGNHGNKGESSGGISNKNGSGNYQNETVEPSSYYSSSIYYGGQENYSPRTSRTTESHHSFKKDKDDDDPNGNNSNSATRGNWWQGSLYY